MFTSVLPHFIDNGVQVVCKLKKADRQIQNEMPACTHSLFLFLILISYIYKYLCEKETVEKQ